MDFIDQGDEELCESRVSPIAFKAAPSTFAILCYTTANTKFVFCPFCSVKGNLIETKSIKVVGLRSSF